MTDSKTAWSSTAPRALNVSSRTSAPHHACPQGTVRPRGLTILRTGRRPSGFVTMTSEATAHARFQRTVKQGRRHRGGARGAAGGPLCRPCEDRGAARTRAAGLGSARARGRARRLALSVPSAQNCHAVCCDHPACTATVPTSRSDLLGARRGTPASFEPLAREQCRERRRRVTTVCTGSGQGSCS